ncbi:MAG TPA: DUF389 domain-containing protein [Anaerolineales bacterium]|nr:DUF389 domain-containing protein [Anaerolineales bacterium]
MGKPPEKNNLEKFLPQKPDFSKMTFWEKVQYRLGRIRLRVRFYGRKLMPPVTKERVAEVQRQLREQSTPDFDYFVLVLLSCLIATLGMLIDSAATIIGAMLVAPLMSPILGIGLASVRGDTTLLRDAGAALIRGALLAIVLSAFVVWINRLLPFVSLQDLPHEVLSRTQPTPIDLGVALAGGLAATFALVQPELSAALPGVAIATALMPPLCAVGVGLAMGRWDVAGGALLLFMTNAITIAASSILLFTITGFSLGRKQEERLFTRGVQISIVLTILLLAPLGWQSYVFVQEANLNREINTVVQEEVGNVNASLDALNWREAENDVLEIEITVLVSSTLRYANSIELQNAIAERLQRTVQLKISQVTVAELDPLVPPTPTPTAYIAPTETPTLTITPTLTLTLRPTRTSTPTFTPTPTVTLTPTPQVGVLTAVRGVPIMAFPGGPEIGYLYRNQMYLVLYAQQMYEGNLWIQVQDLNGRIGWIPQEAGALVTETPTP